MKTFYRMPVMAMAACCLSACLMGGGSDQPNRIDATVSGNVTGRDGLPMAAARIRLYAGEYRTGYDIGLAASTATLDTEVLADSRGSYTLRAFTGAHFLEAASADSQLISIRKDPLPDSGARKLADIPLSEGASLTGILVSSVRVMGLHLAGTHFHAVRDSAGRFRFAPLPPGAYRLVAQMGPDHGGQLVSVETVALEPGQSRDLDSVFAEPDQIPLFDFDSVDPVSRLSGLSFPVPPAGSRIGAWAPRPVNVESTGAYRNRSLHTTVKAKAQTGFALGDGYYDLSKLKAFVFWAKGSGSMEVLFHSEMVVQNDPTLRADITLGPEWKEFRITPADIYSPPGGPTSTGRAYSWDSASVSVSKITFKAGSADADFWLDDLRIEGMNFSDLGPARPAGTDAFP